MKAQELRIGNFVYLSDKGKVWEILDGHEIDECDDNPFSQPIPITEEWLSKFGFEKEPCPHNETMYYWIPNIFSLEKSIEHDSSIVFSHDWGEVEIKYVHELQNLYWVLFGEELTIKE